MGIKIRNFNKPITILFIVILATFKLQGQSPIINIDSLKKASVYSKGPQLIDTYNEIAWNYRNINLDSSLYYSSKAYDMALRSNYLSGISKSLNFIGIAKRNQSNYLSALEYFFKALSYAEKNFDLTQISYALINIGNIYTFQTNYEGACEYFEKALINANKLNDEDLIAYCNANLGRSKIGLMEYKEAESHLIQAIDLRIKQKNKEGEVINKLDLAKLYTVRQHYDNALELLVSNLRDIKLLGHKNTLAYSYLMISEIYLKKNDLNNAKKYVNLSIEISKESHLKKEEGDAYEILAIIQENLNESKNALESYKKRTHIKDSIFSEKNTRKIESLHSSYQFEKKAVETRYLRQQAELNDIIIARQKTIIWLVIITAILFLTAAILSLKAANIRKKLNKQIEEQKEKAFIHNNSLIDLNNEKTKLIRILSHDLRAPVNNIKGLAQVLQMTNNSSFSPEENQVLDHIQNESDRLISMITKILNKEAIEGPKHELQRIDICTIVQSVITSFGPTAQSKAIEINSHYSDDVLCTHGDEIHISQIIENLLSNAIKFSEREQDIDINIQESPNNKIKVEIKDRGPGLTKSDKEKIFKKFEKLSAKPTGNEESTGLGLSIVKRYVEQMDGRVWYESKLGKGTSFFVEFNKVD